jgi:hypothetical protein
MSARVHVWPESVVLHMLSVLLSHCARESHVVRVVAGFPVWTK